MKVILCMATTINGLIAKEDDDTSFVSETEWENFQAMIKTAGNLVIGRRTYEIMRDGGEFENLENIRVLIVSNRTDFKTVANNHSVVKSPKDALAILEKEGFNKTLVGGGGTLNTSFMTESLVDEIFLDIEPLALGRGIKLFADADFEAKLELVDTKQLSPNELQVHYRVLK